MCKYYPFLGTEYSNDDATKPGSDPDIVPGLTEEGTYALNYLSVYELMPHDDNIQAEDLFQYSLVRMLALTHSLHNHNVSLLHEQKPKYIMMFRYYHYVHLK